VTGTETATIAQSGLPTRRDLLGLFGSVSIAGLIPGVAHAATAISVYRDVRAPVDLRVRDLMARMTLEEKIGQTISLWATKADVMTPGGLDFDPARATVAYPAGFGQVTRPSDKRGGPSVAAVAGGTGAQWRGSASTIAFVNAVQRWARGTRLGIPVIFHEESLHGYMAPDATMFPQAIGMAGAFDRDLMRRAQAIIGREVRAHGSHLSLSPVVDIARDPRWGRIEETFGEDPYLCGEMGVAAVEGLQGDSTTLGAGKVFATLKHDRPRPAPGGQQYRPRTDRRARTARELLPAVPRGRDAHGDRRGDAVVQRDRRGAEPCESLAAR
jgi:beta-glucosidase